MSTERFAGWRSGVDVFVFLSSVVLFRSREVFIITLPPQKGEQAGSPAPVSSFHYFWSGRIDNLGDFLDKIVESVLVSWTFIDNAN